MNISEDAIRSIFLRSLFWCITSVFLRVIFAYLIFLIHIAGFFFTQIFGGPNKEVIEKLSEFLSKELLHSQALF